METTGYVLRLCPFESLAFSAGVAITEEDLAAFVEVGFLTGNVLLVSEK